MFLSQATGSKPKLVFARKAAPSFRKQFPGKAKSDIKYQHELQFTINDDLCGGSVLSLVLERNNHCPRLLHDNAYIRQ